VTYVTVARPRVKSCAIPVWISFELSHPHTNGSLYHPFHSFDHIDTGLHLTMKRAPSFSLVTIALGLLSGVFGDDPGPTLEDATYDPAVRTEFEEAISFSLNPDADVTAQFSDSCVLTQPKECIKTAAEFEKKLQDYITLELILCDGFKYAAKKAFDLSLRTKKVKCAGKCYIKGYHFTPKSNSWITVTKAGHQEWCGVTFDDFQGDGVSEISTVQLGRSGGLLSYPYFYLFICTCLSTPSDERCSGFRTGR
jgi:hypothetical protein